MKKQKKADSDVSLDFPSDIPDRKLKSEGDTPECPLMLSEEETSSNIVQRLKKWKWQRNNPNKDVENSSISKYWILATFYHITVQLERKCHHWKKLERNLECASHLFFTPHRLFCLVLANSTKLFSAIPRSLHSWSSCLHWREKYIISIYVMSPLNVMK